MIKTIPLSKLLPSPRNVRRATDEAADLQLKADIETRGLLQNLVVAGARKPKGCFTVEAGGRRLRALQSLVGEGKLSDSHEVCCLVIDGGPAAAQEASLAENFQRLAMNPADECTAFGQLIAQGADVEGIARRFGLTVRFVEGRLRLAGLAPVVFDALGSGEISLDIAKAYAATPDQERQAFVFEQVSRSYMGSHPDSIRRMMTQACVNGSDRRARFVGEEAYVAAGGRIERDLFSDEDGEHWLDIALLERLAAEKLDSLAGEMASSAGLAFLRPTLDTYVGYGMTDGLQRVRLEPAPLTDEQSAELEALEAELETCIAALEDEEIGEEARATAEARMPEIDARIVEMVDRPPVIPEELKPRLGRFLMLDQDGRPTLDSGYYVEALPEPEEDQSQGAEGRDGSDGCGTGSASDVSSASCSEPARKEPSLSQALLDELAMQRRDILAVHVAADPALALDLAIFLMVDRDVGYSYEKSGSSLIANPPTDPVFGFKTPNAAATIARAQAAEALDRSWMEAGSRSGRFDAFRALTQEARAAWLGHAVARTLEASLGSPGGRICPFHDHLAQLLGIEVAKWWRPTGANFFDRVPKNVTLVALEEVGGPTLAARYAKAKKAELAQSAERIFAGDFIAEVEVKQAALAWVPEVMRFGASAAAPLVDHTPPWEEEPVTEVAAETGPEARPADDGPIAPLADPVSGSGEADIPSGEEPQERGGCVEESPHLVSEEVDQAA